VSRRFYRVAGRLTVGTPKSERGARTVPLPAFVATAVRRHLAELRAGAGRDDLVFTTSRERDVLDGYSQVQGALKRGFECSTSLPFSFPFRCRVTE
jgi:hypothetical protein